MSGQDRPLAVELERSTFGRVLMTIVMVVVMGSIALWNLPAGRPRAEARQVVGPLLLPLGLDQDWSVFAPNPRAFSVGFSANVTYADGRVRGWRTPDTGKVLAPFATYRWQKYNERVRGDDYRGIWEEAARYIARDAGPGVTRVELLRDFRPAVVPGSGAERPANQRLPFFTLDLP